MPDERKLQAGVYTLNQYLGLKKDITKKKILCYILLWTSSQWRMDIQSKLISFHMLRIILDVVVRIFLRCYDRLKKTENYDVQVKRLPLNTRGVLWRSFANYADSSHAIYKYWRYVIEGRERAVKNYNQFSKCLAELVSPIFID